MNDFKDKLSDFSKRLTTNLNEASLQEVRPAKQANSEKIILTTIHLPESVHKKIKLHCVASNSSIKAFITDALIEAMKKV